MDLPLFETNKRRRPRVHVDTLGHAEPSSIEIVASPNPAFDTPTRAWILRAQFRPARMHGQAVRVHVTLPVDYSIRPS